MAKLYHVLKFYYYRITTIIHAIIALFSLTEKDLDAFFKSYIIYDHDWEDKDEMIRVFGKDYAQEVSKRLIDYYSVLNYLCAIGEVEKMYIPPIMHPKKGIIANQNLFEEKMCKDLDVKPGDKVLDIGCGRGRVANHVCEYTGATVYGFNVDPTQLKMAEIYTHSTGNKCYFKQWDINNLPLPYDDGEFDAIYHIQVFSLSKDLGMLFKEINRILKPGGKVSCLDWCVLDKYEKNNEEHQMLMKRVKPLIGAIGCPSNKEYAKAMEMAGFELTVDQNASYNGLQSPLIDNADVHFNFVGKVIKTLTKWGLIPKYIEALFDRFTKDGQAFVEMDRRELVTSCYHLVGKKPLDVVRN